MTLKSTTTKFNFSYGELLQQALEKSTFFRRDESILAQRGVTSNNLDVFDDLITSFRETKEDNIFLGLISDAIQKRDDKRKQVELIGRDIVGIAETVYGSKSGIYKSFGFTSSKSLNDGEFLIAADTLHSKATEYSASLNPRGLTIQMLTEFRNLIDELEPLVKYLAAAKSDRDINTRTRHTIANSLYAEMTALCLIAGNYFKDRDAARYSDYVIYYQSKTAQTRSGTLNPKTIISRSFTGLTSGLLLKLKNEGTGPLDFYFSTTEGGVPITESITIPQYQEQTVTIEAMGYDSQTGAIKFNIRNSSETDTTSYLVRIE